MHIHRDSEADDTKPEEAQLEEVDEVSSQDDCREPSGEQLALALQCLQSQLHTPAEAFVNPVPQESAVGHPYSHLYPKIDLSQYQSSQKLEGGVSKTRLEQEIQHATSKVNSAV